MKFKKQNKTKLLQNGTTKGEPNAVPETALLQPQVVMW